MAVRFSPFLIVLCAFVAACGSRTGKSFVPTLDGYDEKGRKTFVLHDDLLEISGFVLLDTNNIAAINDERGQLYFLNLQTDSIQSFRFKGKGDYEDLVKVGNRFYVLESNGDIVETVPPYDNHTTYKFKIKGKKEFESLVWYSDLNKLVLITKDQRKKTQDGITAYAFDLDTKQFDQIPFFEITLKDIFIKLSSYNAECKPSGAALHPINKRLYIIASIGKLLLECEPTGKLVKIFKINPTHFPQPEGINFAANGDMYISNEGADGKATVLKYPYVGKK